MQSEFPRTPKIGKDALAAYQLPELPPTTVGFQCSPEQLTHSPQARKSYDGGDAQQPDWPP